MQVGFRHGSNRLTRVGTQGWAGLGWPGVKTAGCDPVQVIAELGQRAPLLHIKDGPAVKGQPMIAAGDGVLDFPAILQASNGAAEWLIVELDECATDMFTAVARSYDYLTANNLGNA